MTEEKGITTMLSDILSLGKLVREFAEALPASVNALGKTPDIVKRLKVGNRVVHAIENIRERLFTRHVLIDRFQAIADEGAISQDEFDRLTSHLSDRIDDLKKFNEEIPEIIAQVDSPRLAADLVTLTNTSIKYYEKMITITNKDDMVALATKIIPQLTHIANTLDTAREKLESYQA